MAQDAISADLPRAALVDPQPPIDSVHYRSLRKASDEDERKHHKRAPPENEAGTEGARKLFANSPVANPPEQAVQQVCRKEIVSFCYAEVADAWRVHESSANPDDLRVALRSVYVCLARNGKLLSPECFSTLVQFVQLPPAAPVLPALPSAANAVQTSSDGYRSSKHKHYHDDDDSSDGHGRRPGTHPIVWVFVLPFFLLGLFVASKKGVKFAKQWHRSFLQRRELAKGEVRNSEDYAPLKVQEPS